MTTAWDQVEQEFACSHVKCEIRYQVYSNGTRHYFKQCLECGQQVGSAIAHDRILQKDQIKPFDEGLEQEYQDARDRRYRELRDQQQQAWLEKRSERQKEYHEYLKSTQWQEKSRAVLQRDGYTCQACLHRRATQAHHRTYDHIYNEPLFDLVAICPTCHERLHQNNGAPR